MGPKYKRPGQDTPDPFGLALFAQLNVINASYGFAADGSKKKQKLLDKKKLVTVRHRAMRTCSLLRAHAA